MMKPKTMERIQTAIGVIAIVLALGVLGRADFEDEELSAIYTAEIMADAKEKALSHPKSNWVTPHDEQIAKADQ